MAPRARHPGPVLPYRDRYSFGSLRDGTRDTLINWFLRWAFRRPGHRGTARALQQGEWLPMQPDYMEGEQPLGEGGSGIVHVWCCVDHNKRILDRVIVKQVHPGVFNWARKDKWRNGEIGGEPLESMLGNEVCQNLEASAVGHGKFVTECLGYGGMQDPLMGEDPATGMLIPRNIAGSKLYLEYCPYGNLADAIFRQEEAEELFHEGFIWMVFEALAECAVAMNQSKIVHADITASNILLSNNDPQRFKIWPTPKLSDFGSSRIIDRATRRRLTGTDEAMHPYFTPPELARNGDNTWTVPKLQVTRKTNIWSIGLLICCLMCLEPEHSETMRTDDDPPEPFQRQLRFDMPNQREIRKLQHNSARYSRDLRNIARACMRYDPARRPNPSVLLRRIRRLMPNHLEGFDMYGRNSRIPWNKKERLKGHLKDFWAVGTMTEERHRV